MASEPAWPNTTAMGTLGWRRESITSGEIRKCKVCLDVLGTEWTWQGIPKIEFREAGVLKTPWGTGKWGIPKRVSGMPECERENRECLFADFANAAHHLSFDLPNRFKSMRVSNGEIVVGRRLVHGVET